MSIYISAPINLDSYYIEQFIISKKDWIEKHKNKIKSYVESRQEETYKQDSKYRLLNKLYTIKLEESILEKVEFHQEKSIVKIFTLNFSSENIKKILKNMSTYMQVKFFQIG